MKTTMLMTTAFCAWCVLGAEYTWTGGGVASDWTDAANWTGGGDGSYPQGGDKAIVGSDATIGTMVAVAGGTSLEITVAKGCRLVFTGALSGSGDLAFTGTGHVYFTASSASYSGDVTFSSAVAGARAYLVDPKGMGSGLLRFNGEAALWITNSMSLANDIEVNSSNAKYVSSTASIVFRCTDDSATMTFNGAITASTNLVYSMADGGNKQTTTFNGDIKGPKRVEGEVRKFSILGNPASGGGSNPNTVSFRAPINAPGWEVYCGNSQVNLEFWKPGNSYLYLNSFRSITKLNASDVLPRDGYLKISEDFYNTVWTGNGTVQTCRGFTGTLDKSTMHMTIKNVNSRTSTMVFNGDCDQHTYAQFQGPVNLVWNPDGDYTLELPRDISGRTYSNTMTGSLVASNGTMHLTRDFQNVTNIVAHGENGEVLVGEGVSLVKAASVVLTGGGRFTYNGEKPLTGLKKVKVLDDSVFVVKNASTVPDDVAYELSSDARIDVGTGYLTISPSSVTIDGQALEDGVYVGIASPQEGGSYLPVLGENVMLVVVDRNAETVEPVAARWDAGGLEDTKFSTAANWEGDEVPAFSAGNVAPVFSTLTGTATVVSAVTLGGFDYADESGQGLFTLASEGGSVAFANGASLKVAAGGANVEFEENLPVAFEGGASVEVGSGSTLALRGPVEGVSPADILFHGGGRLDLYGDNSFNGRLLITNGQVHAWSDDAFGSSYGETELRAWKTSTSQSDRHIASVTFHGITTSERFLWSSKNVSYGFYFPNSTTNTLKGAISKSGVSTYFSFLGGSRTVFEGGLVQTQNNIDFSGAGINVGGSPEVVITNTPFANNGGGEFRFHWQKLVLWAKGNVFRNTVLNQGVEVRVETDDAFDDSSSLKVSGISASTAEMYKPRLLLGGHDIRLQSVSATNRFLTVQTDDPAKMTLLGSKAVTNVVKFAGPVGLEQAGSGRYVIALEESSTNVLAAAENGTVEILEGGSWAGALAISDAGCAVLGHTGALSAPATEIRVFGEDWNLVLPEGETVKARRLVKDGNALSGGLYGPVGSGADYELANITGGFLKVSGPNGMQLIVR